MNRKRIALLTGLTLLTNSTINSINPLRHPQKIDAAVLAKQKELKKTSKYPDISKKLDLTSMEQYSSVNLFMNVTLKNFYIKDSTTFNGQTYILITPIKSSNQYFLINTRSVENLGKKPMITVQGFLNGKTRISQQLVNSGLNRKYLNVKVVTLSVDNFNIK